MSQFQIIASVIMLIIIFLTLTTKLFAKKDNQVEGLSPEEKAFLFPDKNDLNEPEFKQTEFSKTATDDAEFEGIIPFDIIEAIKTGQKLLAVKLYRKQFGTDLKTSIAAVEGMKVYREQFGVNMKK